jgi:prolyl oligopeptidase
MSRRGMPIWGLSLLVSSAVVKIAAAQRVTYATTRRDSVVDTYFGTRVADPYRWLERLDDSATTAWVSAQQRTTQQYVERLRGREWIVRRLRELSRYRHTDVPWREAARVFYTESSGLDAQPVLYSESPNGRSPRIVLDPKAISPDGRVAVSDFAVSPDGRWLSYATSPGGADVATTHVRSLADGRDRPDAVSRTLGSACWTADGAGFFAVKRPGPAPGDPPDASRIEKQLVFHVVGQPESHDRVLHEWTDNVRWLYCMFSDDGRRAIVVAQRGASDWMFEMDLRRARKPDLSAPLVPLLGGHEAAHTPLGTVGDTLYVMTTLDAPRGQVIALNLADGANARPRTIVPETEHVIDWATVAGDRLVLHYLVDVKSRLETFSLGGAPRGEIPLPGMGRVGWPLNGRHSAPELFYSFESFLSPSTVYRYDLASGKSTPVRAPRVPFDASTYETRQVFYPTSDGTRVPMFITAKRSMRLDGTNPVLLTAYGGFGSITGPSYSADIPLWLEMGGIYAVANVRGGGEYGEAWHHAGSREHKQTSFDDFVAATEFLIQARYTSKGKIAIYGYSNGGLLVGAVETERPDLYAVAIANAGHHDMLRFHKFTVGAGWIPEYGSPDDSTAFQWLRAYSPLHNVRAGTCYPATLLLTGDHDDRVVPSHSYKFAAALQSAQGCWRPILLRVARDASHSYASRTSAVAELADRWAFTAARLGVTVGQAR